MAHDLHPITLRTSRPVPPLPRRPQLVAHHRPYGPPFLFARRNRQRPRQQHTSKRIAEVGASKSWWPTLY